jgi:hypothetical protein
MKLALLVLLGALPTSALIAHHHHHGAASDAARAFARSHADAFHDHMRALHEWLMPGKSMPAPVPPSVAPAAPTEAIAPVAPGAPSDAAPAAHPVIGYDLNGRTGIEWHRGLDAVLGGAKPILLFQLFGEFDQVHC